MTNMERFVISGIVTILVVLTSWNTYRVNILEASVTPVVAKFEEKIGKTEAGVEMTRFDLYDGVAKLVVDAATKEKK